MDEINNLPEGTVLWYTHTNMGKLHFYKGYEAVFQYGSSAWPIKNAGLYSLATDSEAMIWKLENA